MTADQKTEGLGLVPVSGLSRSEGISMIRTICTSICAVIIFLAAVIPVAILIIDKV